MTAWSWNVAAALSKEVTEFPKPFKVVRLPCAPAVTVIRPESVVVRLPLTAWIVAVPERCPVKTALVDEPTRSPSAVYGRGG